MLKSVPSLFEREFAVFPVNPGNHWYLAIFYQPGNGQKLLDQCEKDSSFLFFLDSYPSTGIRHKPSNSFVDGRHGIDSFLVQAAKYSSSSVDTRRYANIEYIIVPVESQQDGYNCGIHMLHYAEKFMTNPDEFLQDMLV